jgi:hypothetical protein
MAQLLNSPLLSGADVIGMCSLLADTVSELTAPTLALPTAQQQRPQEQRPHQEQQRTQQPEQQHQEEGEPGGSEGMAVPLWLLQDAACVVQACRVRAAAGVLGDQSAGEDVTQRLASLEGQVRAADTVNHIQWTRPGMVSDSLHLSNTLRTSSACCRHRCWRRCLQVTLRLAQAHTAARDWAKAAACVQSLEADAALCMSLLTHQQQQQEQQEQEQRQTVQASLACMGIQAAAGLGQVPAATHRLLTWLHSPACSTPAEACSALTAYLGAVPAPWASAECLAAVKEAAALLTSRCPSPLAAAATAACVANHLLGSRVRTYMPTSALRGCGVAMIMQRA